VPHIHQRIHGRPLPAKSAKAPKVKPLGDMRKYSLFMENVSSWQHHQKLKVHWILLVPHHHYRIKTKNIQNSQG